MEWYAGTSGYSYKEWKGLFYPSDISNDAMLAYYAERLSTVEINNTFYRMPKRSVVQSWGEAVPDHFRFSIKASRRITHQMRLKESEESVGILAKQLEVLGDKLGAVLFQLPPYLKFEAERLTAFLAIVPKTLPIAFEFRHASWFNTETYDALHAHGAALCLTEDGELPLPDRDATTSLATNVLCDGGEGKPVGLAFIGLAWNDGSSAFKVNWFGSRIEIQNRTTKSALNFLRLWLTK